MADFAWRPTVPHGHTSFSWKRRPGGSQKSAKKVAGAAAIKDADIFEEPPLRKNILPETGKRNILITSALPYVNNVPHLGNIIGCVLSADVYARFCRLRGHNAVYICGTDEYGTATETKAIQANMTPQQICDKYHKIHKEVYDWFDIRFDHFGRTTTKEQTMIAQDIFWKADSNKFVVQQDVTQLYSEKLGFLSDRYVFGTCPLCGYDDAGGDQCDKCGKLINAIDLIEPKAKLDPTAVVGQKTSTHLFLDLESLQETLDNWVNKSFKKGQWSNNSLTTTKTWIKEGLRPRCITRDLKWGTPVPKKGFEDKVFYVWFDAPIGYLSITANYTKDWEKWWKNPEDVELVQFMGKDNIPFHTVIFPCSLLATKENYTMLHHISTTEYLNYESGKFSKSRGVGVFGNDAQETDIPSMVWRYYLLTNRPESNDSVFMWDDFAARNNNELLNNLGNFVNRIISFVNARFDSIVPDFSTENDSKFMEMIQSHVTEYVQTLEKYKLRQGLHLAMKLSKEGNLFMQENQPWVLFKQDKPRCACVLGLCINLVYVLGILLQPYMPSFTRHVCTQLNFQLKPDALKTLPLPLFISAGHKIGKATPLFRKIDDAEVAKLRAKYAGSQEDRDDRATSEAASANAVEKTGPVLPLEIKAGLVTEVKDHPSADSLYVLTIDMGEDTPRTVVSGLKSHMDKSAVEGKTVVVVCNAKQSKFKGVLSQGMVLTAEKDGKLEILITNAKPGSVAESALSAVKSEKNFDIRKKFSKLEFSTGSNGAVLYAGSPLLLENKFEILAIKSGAGALVK